MTRHLSSEELIDLAEGARAREDAPHLSACRECRGRLDAIVATMSAAAEVDVPEPSPLFWDHLSARVRESVHAAGAPGASRGRFGFGAPGGGRMPWFQPALAGVVMLAMAAAVFMRSVVPGAPSATPEPAAAVSSAAVAELGIVPADDVQSDDASLALVTDLASGLDWDAARDAGLTTDGSAEDAVAHLNEGELRQLQRLLESALAHPGA